MKLARVAVATLAMAIQLAALGHPAAVAKPRQPKAGAGDLDPSFGGGDGIVTTDYSFGDDYGYGVAIQPDGKIIMAGGAHNGGTYQQFAIARYLPDGGLDPSFSGDGSFLLDIGPESDTATAVAIQGDGKIVAVGSTQGVNEQFAAVRLNADGTPDVGFNGDGLVTTQVGTSDGGANAVSIQSDGKIVAVGSAVVGAAYDFAAVRYTTDGSLDTSFSSDGIVTTPVGATHAYAYDVAIQGDGKVILAGTGSFSGINQFAVVRLTTSGSLDSTFSGDGIAVTSFGAYSSANSVRIQADGKIVLGGSSGHFTIVRLNVDGSLDSSFGSGGSVVTPIADPDFVYGLALQPDGHIVAAGTANFGGNNDVALARYLTNGSLDASFGGDGVVTTNIGTTSDQGQDVGLQADGRIVVVGYALPASFDIALLRYFGSQPLGSGVPSDFNGDGYGDLAVGAPGEDIGAATETGAVNIIYGSATGLSSTSNQFWDESAGGMGTDASGDLFGWATSTGDFNGDGFADLAVGAPGRQVGTVAGAGSVGVLYGSPAGLASSGSQTWTQDSTDVEDVAELGDSFGYSVAAGDFNGDGFADLAIGVAAEDVGSVVDAGAANVLYGSAAGLSAAGDQFWNQDSPSINDSSESGDVMGLSVAAGDFDGDGFDDLVSGIAGENNGSISDGGAVSVIYGSATGLTSDGDQFWNQNSPDIKDSAEAGDNFGIAVAVGDFDNDGFADLISGVAFENNGIITDGGGANVIYGTSAGLAATGNQWWTQNSTDINDTAEAGDIFGFFVGAGDFDGDGFDDFVAGVPGENNGTIADGGAANVIYGTSGGLTATGDQYWNQNSTGIEDLAEAGDSFGYTVTTGEFGNGPEEDVVFAATLENIGSVVDAGAVNVIYGAPSGLNATGDQFWNQDSTDILDTAEAYDEFGFGLSFGPGTRPYLGGQAAP